MSDLSWRATFWFCFAFAFTVVLLIIFTYPETYRENAKWDINLPTTTSSDSYEDEKRQQQVTTTTGNKDDGSESTRISIEQVSDNASTNSKQSRTIAASSNIDPSSNNNNNNDNNNETTIEIKKKKSLNPIKPFLYLRHPHVLLASLVTAVAFGSMFAVSILLQNLISKTFYIIVTSEGIYLQCYVFILYTGRNYYS